MKSQDKKFVERYELLNQFFVQNDRIMKDDLVDYYSKSSIRISNSKDK